MKRGPIATTNCEIGIADVSISVKNLDGGCASEKSASAAVAASRHLLEIVGKGHDDATTRADRLLQRRSFGWGQRAQCARVLCEREANGEKKR